VAPKPTRQIWGFDVARFGRDSSALARRRSNILLSPIESRYGYDLMQLVGWIKQEYDAAVGDQPEVILIDSNGLGAGVVDRARELGLPVRGINVSESPSMRERYKNLTTELWFKMRAWFEARDSNLAGDDKLMAQLIARKYKLLSNGKMQAETKDEMKKRGMPSPNEADAFMLTFATEATMAQGQKSPKRGEKPRRKLKGIV
jgi:phage terminase large subunit